MEVLVISSLLLLVLAAPSALAVGSCPYEDKIRWTGVELSPACLHYGQNIRECEDLCNQTPACEGWSLGEEGCIAAMSVCALFSNITGRANATGFPGMPLDPIIPHVSGRKNCGGTPSPVPTTTPATGAAACPGAYTLLRGDVRGWGSISGNHPGRTVIQCQQMCDNSPGCCSFEWSPTSRICNLNRECRPTSGQYKDQMFCKKGTPSQATTPPPTNPPATPAASPSSPEATCSIPLENPDINLFKEWSAKKADATDGFCFDNHGLGYGLNQTYIACEGCMEYVCKSRACDDRDGSQHKLWWELDSVASQCCQDREGRVIPPNKGTSSQLGDRCQTEEKTTCVTTAASTGKMEVTYQSAACCVDRRGWNQVGTSKLEASTCSDQVCEAGSPAVWNRRNVHQASNCCAVRGQLVAPGGLFQLNGQFSKCCDGVMVRNATRNLSACHIGDVVYLIDTSGSMPGTKNFWQPVALDIISEFKTAKMNINEFTLMDYVQKISLKTKTTNHAELTQAVQNLTFGGSNELTFAGLKSALQQSPRHNFIVLISDEVGDDTTDKALKADILKLRDATQSKIFFLMVPPNTNTWKSMQNNFKDIGTVIDIKNTKTVIPQIIDSLKKSTICNTHLASSPATTTTSAMTSSTTTTAATTSTVSTTSTTTTTTASTTSTTTVTTTAP